MKTEKLKRGYKNPETGLFWWTPRHPFSKQEWIDAEEYAKRQKIHSDYTQQRKKQKRNQKKKTHSQCNTKTNGKKDASVLNLHHKGKSLFYISIATSLPVSCVQRIIAQATQAPEPAANIEP